MKRELVTVYDTTRARSRRLGNRRLRIEARSARRAHHRDPLDERAQLRLVAYEQELRDRGLLRVMSFPKRPGTNRRRRWCSALRL